MPGGFPFDFWEDFRLGAIRDIAEVHLKIFAKSIRAPAELSGEAGMVLISLPSKEQSQARDFPDCQEKGGCTGRGDFSTTQPPVRAVSRQASALARQTAQEQSWRQLVAFRCTLERDK